jgi:hypothetical protein
MSFAIFRRAMGASGLIAVQGWRVDNKPELAVGEKSPLHKLTQCRAASVGEKKQQFMRRTEQLSA